MPTKVAVQRPQVRVLLAPAAWMPLIHQLALLWARNLVRLTKHKHSNSPRELRGFSPYGTPQTT